jgi:hypothetical protein
VALDPRLDVARSAATDQLSALEGKIADLERRLDAQRNQARVIVGSGAPTIAAPDGVFYIDGAAAPPRLYARVNGAWRYAALT